MNTDDALIAEKLFGWTETFDGWLSHQTGWHSKPPAYTSDASADYECLAQVRETWDGNMGDAFAAALVRLWGERPLECSWITLGCSYRPGDYSKAALAVLKSADKEQANVE